jgi:hypothetical protein
MGPIIKHANIALTIVNALPESFSGCWVPGGFNFKHIESMLADNLLIRLGCILRDEK